MKMLKEDIKTRSFKTAYLLYGEEAYLRSQYKNHLKNALSDPGDTMNASFFQGKNIQPGEIIDLAETLPFFTERRLIVIEDSGFFKGKCDVLADYIPSLPQTTCLLFVEAEVDERTRLFKAVQKHGRAVKFQIQDERTLMIWILGLLKKEGKQITEPTLRFFLERTGPNMELISSELEKLLSYTLGRDVIRTQDIEKVCTVQLTNRIFEMIRAIAERRQTDALNLYYDLLSLEEKPMGILALFARQFQQLLQVKSLAAKGYGKAVIAEKLRLRPFVVGRLISQARNFTPEQLSAAVSDCADAEEAVKTGRMGDRMSVELLIVKYSQ